jgi:hypothetical protein
MVECLLLTQATDMEAVILFGGPDRTTSAVRFQWPNREVSHGCFLPVLVSPGEPVAAVSSGERSRTTTFFRSKRKFGVLPALCRTSHTDFIVDSSQGFADTRPQIRDILRTAATM